MQRTPCRNAKDSKGLIGSFGERRIDTSGETDELH